jgi:phosphoserine phosphatase
MSTEYAITIISHGNELTEQEIKDFETNFLKKQIEVDNFYRKSLSNRALDYQFTSENYDEIRNSIKQEIGKLSYDIILQPAATRRLKKMFIFDMDSTLIYQEVIELIAQYADIEDKVADITTRAMNGELDFNDSLRERVLLLKGIDSTTLWTELQEKIEITKGVRELTTALNKLGVITGVLSGGFIPLAQHIQKTLNLNYAYANTLDVDENRRLNGKTIGTIVNGERKAELLLEIASNHSIDPKDVVAVGDGANDLKMMLVAGFGIAWNAKPKVQQLAPCCLNSTTLKDVLYILGYNDEEIKELTS